MVLKAGLRLAAAAAVVSGALLAEVLAGPRQPTVSHPAGSQPASRPARQPDRQNAAQARGGPTSQPGKAATAPAGRDRRSASKEPTLETRPATLEPAPAPTISFEADVMPVLDKNGCNAAACHGSARGRGGLALSLFGAYPAEDYAAITKSSAGRRIDPVEPDKSLFLLKATNATLHGGGGPPRLGARDVELLTSWLAQGAAWGGRNVSRITALEVSPKVCTLMKDEYRRLTVTAVFSDGKRRDVSADALYRSSDDAVAAAEGGKVQAKGCGQAALVVSYLRHAAVVSVAVPQLLPSALPQTPDFGEFLAINTGPDLVEGSRTENNKVDHLVFARLKALGIPPSPLSSDAKFLRRVYLDVIGLLPTPQEARSFLADRDPQKRAKLIDRLLGREEYANYWAMKWGDLLRIKSEYPSNLWPNGVQAYYHWVRQAIASNKPYDQFTRELLVSSGSNFRDPPCNYWRAVRQRDPQGFAEVTSLVFMGVRLECARCHAHPTENWTRDDNLGMAAFFPQVQFKNTQEWKEEIVLLDPARAFRHPTTGQPIAPKFLGGPTVEAGKDEDLRARFAAWLTSPDNPWFARNIVNRVWYWLLGRGIVHEPDDLRPTNPPSNPELLAYLEGELVSHKYDLKHVYRLILNSRTYQLSSRANEWNARDSALFSHYPIKRLGAEQLLDAIGQVTETSEEFTSNIPEPYTVLPKGWRAIQLADGSMGTAFLELFGRPSRDTAYESERCTQASMGQSLYLVSSPQLETKVAKSPRIDRLAKAGKTDAEIVEELYLAALSRPCGEQEKQKILEGIGNDAAARKQVLADLMWALLNTKEFLFNH